MPEKLSFELPTDTKGITLPENSPTNYEVEVDYYKGESNLAVGIIVGKGGTTQGYENKYITISNNLVKNYGVHVFVIENPGISWDNPELFFDCAFGYIKNKINEVGYYNPEFYMMGYSAGGHFTGRFSYKYPEIKKILLVNPVLRVNNSKLLKALNDFEGTGTIIMGDNDPDFFFFPLLEKITSKIKSIHLPGIDHLFSSEGGLEIFLGLPEKYLFN